MTDWLEELLEETQESLRWGWKAPGGGPGEEEREEELLPTEERELSAADGADAVQAFRRTAAAARDVAAAREGSGQGEEFLQQRGLPGQEGSSLGLYRRLISMGRAAEAARPHTRTAAAEHRSVGSPSLTVDALDRAVRRDSRRYDGAMELY